MTKDQIDLTLSFIAEEISKQEFEKSFPEVLDQEFYEKQFEEAILKKDSDAISCLFLFCNPYTSENYLYSVFKRLIIECWHHEHENIARSFQFHFKNPDCVDSVVKAMHLNCKHWDEEDDREPFIRKCANILAELNTPYSIQKLRELSNSVDRTIRTYCSDQLDRLAI